MGVWEEPMGRSRGKDRGRVTWVELWAGHVGGLWVGPGGGAQATQFPVNPHCLTLVSTHSGCSFVTAGVYPTATCTHGFGCLPAVLFQSTRPSGVLMVL